MVKIVYHIPVVISYRTKTIIEKYTVEQMFESYVISYRTKTKMTGKFRHIKGDIKNHEIVDFNESINLGIDIYSGNIANGMTIHYSKTGAYLIPTYHRKE